jgi:hypothetical protein
MYGKPEHRPRITDYQYVMALVQSGGLAVYGRFLHCPLFRDLRRMAAKVGPRQKSRPGQPYEDRGAVRIPRSPGRSEIWYRAGQTEPPRHGP